MATLKNQKVIKTRIRNYASEELGDELSDNGEVSSCCGSSPRGNGDSDSSDYGICPDCGDHCEYGHYDENGDEWHWDKDVKNFYQPK